MSEISFVVRPMTSRDVPEVARIDARIFPDESTPRDVREARFTEELARPFAAVLVAERHEGETSALEGYLLAWLTPSEGHILNLAVLERSRRLGIAKRLLEALLSLPKWDMITTLVLEVRASNVGARAFYEGRGFTLSRVRRSYYPNGEDALELVLALAR